MSMSSSSSPSLPSSPPPLSSPPFIVQTLSDDNISIEDRELRVLHNKIKNHYSKYPPSSSSSCPSPPSPLSSHLSSFLSFLRSSSPPLPPSLPWPFRRLYFGSIHIDISFWDVVKVWKLALTKGNSQEENKKIQEKIQKTLHGNAENYAPKQGLPSLSSASSSSSPPSSSSSRSISSPLPSSPHILSTLSVRTSFDLYLRLRQYPPQSIVLCTAINIPDMIHIIKYHNLIPLPIDINFDTSSPIMEIAEKFYEICRREGKNIVGFLVSNLYGKRCDMNNIIQFCKPKGIEVWEDNAESFMGCPHHYMNTTLDMTQHAYNSYNHSNYTQYILGHPLSDLIFYSFGTIKVTTSYGGGITIIRNSRIYHEMHSMYHDSLHYSPYSSLSFLYKISKTTLVTAILNFAPVGYTFYSLCHLFGYDHRDVAVELVRGFNVNVEGEGEGKGDERKRKEDRELRYRKDLVENQLRKGNNTAMLAFLEHRMKTFHNVKNNKNINENTHLSLSSGGYSNHLINTLKSDLLTSLLLSHHHHRTLFLPNLHSPHRHYWLYPLLVRNPKYILATLPTYGVDVYQGATQLKVIDMPVERVFRTVGMDGQWGELSIHNAKYFMDNVVYLPVHRRLKVRDIVYMAAVIQLVNEKEERELDKRERESQNGKGEKDVGEKMIRTLPKLRCSL